jgi:hypothetical protein
VLGGGDELRETSGRCVCGHAGGNLAWVGRTHLRKLVSEGRARRTHRPPVLAKPRGFRLVPESLPCLTSGSVVLARKPATLGASVARVAGMHPAAPPADRLDAAPAEEPFDTTNPAYASLTEVWSSS